MPYEEDDDKVYHSHIGESAPGSDELLSDDELRLPEGSHTLVRVHAVQAWLSRRVSEARLATGEAALALREASARIEAASGQFMRRRDRERQEELLSRLQQSVVWEQARADAYEEARALLQECIDHAGGERVLVEFYLALEELVAHESVGADTLSGREVISRPHAIHGVPTRSPRLSALADVQQRVERVGIPYEEP